jgi:8-oxo-dGTP pyrophosphatase MutT (NUDIX family)
VTRDRARIIRPTWGEAEIGGNRVRRAGASHLDAPIPIVDRGRVPRVAGNARDARCNAPVTPSGAKAHNVQQAAAIPVKRIRGQLHLCLIRRKGSKSWGIPKGLVDPGDTHEETALNEAWEEAGLSGRLVGKRLGSYEYDKWGTTLTVAVYLMEVFAQEARWEEAVFRERRWALLDDAVTLLKRHPVRSLLDRARRRIAEYAI